MHGYWTSDRPPIYALSPEGGGGAAGAINIWDAEKKGSKVKASRAYAGATPSPPKLIPRRVRSMPKLPPLGGSKSTSFLDRQSKAAKAAAAAKEEAIRKEETERKAAAEWKAPSGDALISRYKGLKRHPVALAGGAVDEALLPDCFIRAR